MGCLTGAKYTMTATLLHVVNDYAPVDSTEGSWVESQDPLTGQIVNKWQPGSHEDDVLTPDVDETTVGDFKCVARGTSTSDRYGSTEKFGKDYQNIDIVRMWVPTSTRIKKSDRITNIRNGNTTLWIDDDGQPITFNVNGVIPQFGPFNAHVEDFLLLERVGF
jgi:hypothetical protein